MSRRAQENIAALIVAALFVSVIAASLDFGPRARLVPLPVAIFGLVLTLVQIAWQNLRGSEDAKVDLLTLLAPGAPTSATPATAEEPRHAASAGNGRSPLQNEGIAFGVVAALLVLTLTVGPLVASFIFTGGYFLLTRHYSAAKSVLYTALFAAAIYLLFAVALEIQLYHGFLEPLVERMR